MKLYGFSKKERIRRQKDFLALLKEGERKQTPHFVVFIRPNTLPYARLGIRVGRKVGKAVQRNRLRRLIREFFRQNKYKIGCYDIIIAAKGSAAALNYHQVCEELSNILCVK
ncbi:MAG TPA: ribonuclease P protein component [Candidatus Desulfofervidus auxilii]|uniref:Ribonuclease P protein component n=1 Tax=Desulfofervidus auxilii TaxID=1621989 RepID=A0A7V0NEP1_DESA2|nr:ribonuclease P protein component [Candidatus Desulfofervidus auxilii]